MKNRIREARFRANMPQAKLGYETGISYSTVNRIEKGYLDPTDEQMRRIANALGVKTSWLFPGRKDTPNESPAPIPA